MGNTFAMLHCHVVFGTKRRERWLRADIEERVWSYLGGIARAQGVHPVEVGGIEDHLHVLIGLPTTMAVSKAVQLLKGGSSIWLRRTFREFDAFQWQDGYGAFAVSKSLVPAVAEYVRNQREHHRSRTFQEEYLELLRQHEVIFDERYLWD